MRPAAGRWPGATSERGRIFPAEPGSSSSEGATTHRTRLATFVVLLALSFASAPSGKARADFRISDAPPIAHLERPRFQVDAGSFLGPRGPEVALALRVPYSELFFKKVDDRWRARVDVIMVLYQGKKQVGGDLWPETIEVTRWADTRSETTSLRKTIRLRAKPGDLRAEVTLREPDSGRDSKLDWNLVVPAYDDDVSISTLFVSGCLDTLASTGPGDPWLPPGDWVLNHRYGEPLPPLCVVGDVYRNKPSTAPAKLVWRVRDEQRATILSGEELLESGATMPFHFRPDFSSLWLGTYTLLVSVDADGRRAERDFLFQMDESMVSLEKGLEQSLSLVRLIANDAEVDSIAHAEGPAARKDAWAAFWKERDPSPDTPENEFKDQFFARVRYANDHFGVLEPGWRSDRGRIYIQYGTPDEVERHEQNIDGPPYEIWLYHAKNRRFVFVDYDGFGRYELYQPGRSGS